jgi:hypothetical protein
MNKTVNSVMREVSPTMNRRRMHMLRGKLAKALNAAGLSTALVWSALRTFDRKAGCEAW